MSLPTIIANSATAQFLRRIWPGSHNLSTKHNYYADFGWKEELTFDDFYRMYARNSLAAAAVDKTIGKTWESVPALWENDDPADSKLEQEIASHFTERGIWRSLMNVDRRSMVGAYAGAIILVRDAKPLDQPVERVRGGIRSIAAIIPVWEGQITVSEWEQDPMSDDYGKPKIYDYQEANVGQQDGKPTQPLRIHPSRMIIWSEDGTIHGRSDLEPGFNDLIDAEKIKGAGGEGFWKSARGAQVIEVNPDVSAADAQRMIGGSTPDEINARFTEKIDNLNSGFDKALFLAGMTAKTLDVTLPQPKEFFDAPVQCFAASMGIPYKVLIGNVTGERASTEDAREWAQTCMSRRANLCIPVIEEMVRRFVAWGVLPAKKWTVGWDSLLEETPDAKIERAAKMAEINAKSGNERVFLPDEIREQAGFVPGDEVEGWEDTIGEDNDPNAPGDDEEPTND